MGRLTPSFDRQGKAIADAPAKAAAGAGRFSAERPAGTRSAPARRKTTERRRKPMPSADFLLLKRRIARWLPRHPRRILIGAFAALTVLVVTLVVADLSGRHSRIGRVLLAMSGKMGMSVHNVLVDGRGMTPGVDILRALDVGRGTPILAINPQEARNQLEALPWVSAATVERELPDTLHITLKERRPLALWQYHEKMSLIDSEGVVVTTEDLGRFANLLLVVGEKAPAHTQTFLSMLATAPDLMKRVTSGVWVGDRRWDVHFDNGVVAQLPEEHAREACLRLAAIQRNHDILGRDIQRIDMRLGDRVVVQENPQPAPPDPKKGKAKTAKAGTKPT
ncbi:MAG TPA: cell division protein FtsQ/DivIB [Stellaceae bacterium]|jgi:cell division protein FtsQ|nr:cell division protein FtsQ/DivIB [Stellaceae bacterium]